MTTPTTRTRIGGIATDYNPTHTPSAYRANADHTAGLRGAIDRLQTATTIPLGYKDPETDEWVEVQGHVAVVNPDWLGDGLEDCPKNDALWSPRSDNYDPANPEDCWVPLIHAARDYGVSEVFGQVREYRVGGEMHMDVFFPELTVPFPDATAADEDKTDDEKADLVLGVTTGTDHFGATTLYSRVIAFDPNTGTVLRNLTEKRRRKHVKPAGEDAGRSAQQVAAWWVEEFERMETVTDSLFQAILDAQEYEIDFAGIPFTPTDFYDAVGVPEDYAEKAHARLGGDRVDDAAVTAWDLHAALTATLEAEFGGKTDGYALGRHIGTANTILFEPPRMEERAIDSWRTDLTAGDGETQTRIDGQPVDALLVDRKQTAADRTDEYQSMKTRVRAMLTEAKRTADAGDDDEADADANDGEADGGREVSA